MQKFSTGLIIVSELAVAMSARWLAPVEPQTMNVMALTSSAIGGVALIVGGLIDETFFDHQQWFGNLCVILILAGILLLLSGPLLLVASLIARSLS